MRPLLIGGAAAALGLAGAATAAPPAPSAPGAVVAPARLSVDTPLIQLIEDPRTEPVISRRFPGMIERFKENPESLQIFGGSSIRDMVADPHVRGLTPAIVEKIDAELAAAQAAPAPT